MTGQNGHPDCIVIAPPGATIAGELRDTLQQRGRTFSVVDDPFRGFALLCLSERLQSARSAWGLERAAPPVLVLAATLDDATFTNLMTARDRYLPSVAVYRWRDDALDEVRAAEPAQQHVPDGRGTAASAHPAGRDAPVVQPVSPPDRTHELRLTEPMQPPPRMPDQPPGDVPPRPDDVDDADDASESDRPASLSAEEVQMLLGTEEGPSPR